MGKCNQLIDCLSYIWKKEEQEHQRQLNVRRALYIHRGQWWGGSGSSSSKMATPGKRVFFRSVFLTLHTPDTHEIRPTIISTYTVNAPSISITTFTMNTEKKTVIKIPSDEEDSFRWWGGPFSEIFDDEEGLEWWGGFMIYSNHGKSPRDLRSWKKKHAYRASPSWMMRIRILLITVPGVI